METNKDFVLYQEASDLKMLGFDEPCLAYWQGANSPEPTILCYQGTIYVSKFDTHRNTFLTLKEDPTFVYTPEPKDADTNLEYMRLPWGMKITAPTYSQAFKFFRENHDISFYINDYYKKEFWSLYGRAFQIFIEGNQQHNESSSSYSVELYFKYEDAELACLKKLIEIVSKQS